MRHRLRYYELSLFQVGEENPPENDIRKTSSLGFLQTNTSEVVQVAVEGVDLLETYFGAYLPQFFYSMLAPLTLFSVLSLVNLTSAIVLFVCVSMIPVTIILIQRWAKKPIGEYWEQYTALGDTFLENLQGLVTTKIYKADEFKHKEMNEQSEHFRKITMKVLTMQLNSITVMDLIAYGGAYARLRSDKCPFMETKTFCSNCKVHCYKEDIVRRSVRLCVFPDHG